MLKKLIIVILCSISTTVFAQKRDSLFVTVSNGHWVLSHKVRKGETVFSVARRFHVPPAQFTSANSLGYNDSLIPHSTVIIPLAAYNLLTTPPVNKNESKPLYYTAADDDDLYRISRRSGVSQSNVQLWNGLPGNDVAPGQKIVVGWILYDATPVNPQSTVTPGNMPKVAPQNPQNTITSGNTSKAGNAPLPPVIKPTEQTDTAIAVSDTARTQASLGAEKLFMQQTSDGQNVVTEKGTAAFFTSQSKKGVEPYFAFFNNAPKGAIIKVKNIGNGKEVYLKVLGPLPQTKAYYNAVIGISSLARFALGAFDKRVWCELSYAGN
ncbi:LysM peptidoglycan-binding domain-containing protein [Chitinophagaceae bacterium MMS25-I14]